MMNIIQKPDNNQLPWLEWKTERERLEKQFLYCKSKWPL